MQVYYYVYYLFLIITLTLYLIYARRDSILKPIGYLLVIAIITEGLVEWRVQLDKPYYFFYHFYGPIEYFFLCLFFVKVIQKKIFQIIIYATIPFFVTISLLISFNLLKLEGYQGMNTIIRGTFLIFWALIALFNLPYEKDLSIFRIPAFWILLGVLFYYGGVFFINGVYNGIQKNYPADKDYYRKIHNIINLAFNYYLYIMISIGILCLAKKK